MGWTHLLDDDGQPTGERVGDEAWDLMGQAFANLIALYQANFNRPPTRAEVEQIVAFAFPRDEELFQLGGQEDPVPEPPVSRLTAGLWGGLGLVLIIVTIFAMLN